MYLVVHVLIFVVGLLIAQTGHPVLLAIGTSVAATGISGWAIFLWIRLSDRHADDRRRLIEMGIVTVFPARSVPIRPEYERRFSNARQHIDFLGFGLRALREDFLADFENWLAHAPIRVLLVDPEAPARRWHYTDQRDLEEGNDVGSIARDVRNFVTATVGIKRAWPERFEVRLYQSVPAVNVCRIDDDVFWGPYLMGEQSRNTPTFLVARTGPMFNLLTSHFEQIWTSDAYSRPAFMTMDGMPPQSVLDHE